MTELAATPPAAQRILRPVCFAAAMARAGLRFPYKAVLTASNRLWRAPDLYREVVREHEAMTARRPISGEQ